MQVALRQRYALLPYLYTLFRAANETGEPVMRPLWYDFPDQAALNAEQEQFMFGPAILSAPVLDQGVSEISIAMPKGEVFYSPSGQRLVAPQSGAKLTYPVTLDSMPWCVSSCPPGT
jgi:mannosyl-oligosaccharide alpha-1,3-glucosidase